MNTKIVMQYKRTKPAWVCWNCEMENELADNACYFCRAERVNARILKPWVEERVFTQTIPPARPFEERKRAAEMASFHPGYTPTEVRSRSSEPEKTGGWVPVLIWGIVLTILIMIIIAANA